MGKGRREIKALASKVLPDSDRLRYLSYLPRLETWRRSRAGSAPLLPDRLALYDHVNTTVLGASPLTYLEFGVFRGESIRQWSQLNRHPESRFIGFDTFTGLPDAWRGFQSGHEQGVFDVGGATPAIPDPRVSFVRGLFQDTLPAFLAREALGGQIVMHVDCDLYSGALFVLTRCNEVLTAGSVVIFDEFSSMLHEFRALEDYCSAYRREYAVVAAVARGPFFTYYPQVAIRML